MEGWWIWLVVILLAYHLLMFWYGRLESPLVVDLEDRLADMRERRDDLRGMDGLWEDVRLLDWCRDEPFDTPSWRQCVGAINQLCLVAQGAAGDQLVVSKALGLRRLASQCYLEHLLASGQDEKRIGELNNLLDEVFYKVYDANTMRVRQQGVDAGSEFVAITVPGS
jgi:hypothetical protein